MGGLTVREDDRTDNTRQNIFPFVPGLVSGGQEL